MRRALDHPLISIYNRHLARVFGEGHEIMVAFREMGPRLGRRQETATGAASDGRIRIR